MDAAGDGRSRSLRSGWIKQAFRKIAKAVNDSNDVEDVSANAVEDEVFIEWSMDQENANSSKFWVCVMCLLSDPRMGG